MMSVTYSDAMKETVAARLALSAALVALLGLTGGGCGAPTAGGIAEPQREAITDTEFARHLDRGVARVLQATGTPGASVAVIKDGKLALLRTWGDARTEPRVAATTDTRYAIGSISKQFCAAALLLLQHDGKLSLDDTVSRFLPEVPHGNQVTIRQLLSHVAGYEDYWPHKYLPPYMWKATGVAAILDGWARRPLNFVPGTKWQYSNTNYAIAGAIVEKLSGEPLFRFMHDRIFAPLRMSTAYDYDRTGVGASTATPYSRYALAPLRAAPREGRGWLFAAGGLAMTAADLARWDLSIINRSLLDSASYRELETEVRLADGSGTGYGLGVELSSMFGHRMLRHSGGTSGFSAMNYLFPDDRAAIVVLTNEQPAMAFASIASLIALSLFGGNGNTVHVPTEIPQVPSPMATVLAGTPHAKRARQMLADLQQGVLDPAAVTDNARSYFTPAALGAYASSLSPLGAPTVVWQVFQEERAGMVERQYSASFADKLLIIATLETRDGRFEQYQVYAAAPRWR